MTDARDDLSELLDDDKLDDDVPKAPLGQLIRPGGDQGEDEEADEVAFALDDPDETLGDVATEHEGAVPAEEAAMHLTEDPPMDDDDGYVDD